MLGDPGSREAGSFRQPGSRSAVRDHLLGGSARPGKSCYGDAGTGYAKNVSALVCGEEQSLAPDYGEEQIAQRQNLHPVCKKS
jgi:hypothetical protein